MYFTLSMNVKYELNGPHKSKAGLKCQQQTGIYNHKMPCVRIHLFVSGTDVWNNQNSACQEISVIVFCWPQSGGFSPCRLQDGPDVAQIQKELL